MEFDLERVPLSRYGSYMTCSVRETDGQPRLFVRRVRGDALFDRMFRVDLLDVAADLVAARLREQPRVADERPDSAPRFRSRFGERLRHAFLRVENARLV